MSYRKTAALDVAQRRWLQQQSSEILRALRVLRGTKTMPCWITSDSRHRSAPGQHHQLDCSAHLSKQREQFYVAAVYFGSVGIKQTRHAIPAGPLTGLTGVIASVIICRAYSKSHSANGFDGVRLIHSQRLGIIFPSQLNAPILYRHTFVTFPG